MPKSDLTLAEKVSTKKTAPRPVRATTGQISWAMSNFLLDRGLINVVIRHVISSRVHVALHAVKRTSTETADKAVDLFYFFINLFIYLFLNFWLCWVFTAVRRLSLVAESRDYSSLRCTCFHCGGFSCCGARALGARASVVVARGL